MTGIRAGEDSDSKKNYYMIAAPEKIKTKKISSFFATR